MNDKSYNEAIANLDLEIANRKRLMANLDQSKHKLRIELNKILLQRKTELQSLQESINITKLKQQKQIKRASKKRTQKIYDDRVIEKRKQIEIIDKQIFEYKKEISEIALIKNGLKVNHLARRNT